MTDQASANPLDFTLACLGFEEELQRITSPVIYPRLLENRILSVSAVAAALQNAAMFGAIMYLPLFVQGVLGKSATNSGIILMPLMLGAIVTSIGAGQVLAKTGRYKVVVVVGFVLAAFGAYLLSRTNLDTQWTTLVRNMVIMGLGLGVAISAFRTNRKVPLCRHEVVPPAGIEPATPGLGNTRQA